MDGQKEKDSILTETEKQTEENIQAERETDRKNQKPTDRQAGR